MSLKQLTKRAISGPGRLLREAHGRRRFARSIRNGDTFIVGYPKSGTNWIGFLLALIVADRATGTRSQITLEESSRWVPDFNDDYFGFRPLPDDPTLGRPRVFKVHAPFDPELARVIYVVRDPRDVIVSYFYHKLRTKTDFEMSIEEYVETNDNWPGDWGEHVTGWLEAIDEDRVLLVRYEDLQTDPTSEFRRIVDFSGFEIGEVELAEYVERSSFTNMRRAEVACDGDEAGELRFTRKGVVGDWRNELSPESVSLIEKRYGSLMVSLGYEPSVREAV
jgi:hypothetical protein